MGEEYVHSKPSASHHDNKLQTNTITLSVAIPPTVVCECNCSSCLMHHSSSSTVCWAKFWPTVRRDAEEWRRLTWGKRRDAKQMTQHEHNQLSMVWTHGNGHKTPLLKFYFKFKNLKSGSLLIVCLWLSLLFARGSIQGKHSQLEANSVAMAYKRNQQSTPSSPTPYHYRHAGISNNKERRISKHPIPTTCILQPVHLQVVCKFKACFQLSSNLEDCQQLPYLSKTVFMKNFPDPPTNPIFFCFTTITHPPNHKFNTYLNNIDYCHTIKLWSQHTVPLPISSIDQIPLKAWNILTSMLGCCTKTWCHTSSTKCWSLIKPVDKPY